MKKKLVELDNVGSFLEVMEALQIREIGELLIIVFLLIINLRDLIIIIVKILQPYLVIVLDLIIIRIMNYLMFLQNGLIIGVGTQNKKIYLIMILIFMLKHLEILNQLKENFIQLEIKS